MQLSRLFLRQLRLFLYVTDIYTSQRYGLG